MWGGCGLLSGGRPPWYAYWLVEGAKRPEKEVGAPMSGRRLHALSRGQGVTLESYKDRSDTLAALSFCSWQARRLPAQRSARLWRCGPAPRTHRSTASVYKCGSTVGVSSRKYTGQTGSCIGSWPVRPWTLALPMNEMVRWAERHQVVLRVTDASQQQRGWAYGQEIS